MQDIQSYRQSPSVKDKDTHGFKNCSTEICQNPGLNPLKSTCIKDGTFHTIGFFCDVCKKQLQEIETRLEPNYMYTKGVEVDIGF